MRFGLLVGTPKIRQRTPKRLQKGRRNTTKKSFLRIVPAESELDMSFVVFGPHQPVPERSRKASEIQSERGTPSDLFSRILVGLGGQFGPMFAHGFLQNWT